MTSIFHKVNLRALLICSLAVTLVLTVACISNNKTTEPEQPDTGELSILSEGDTWTHRFTLDGVNYTGIYKVTGHDLVNGQDCYIVQTIYEPPMGGVVGEATVRIDKDNRFVLTVQTPPSLAGTPYEVDTSIEYEFIDCQYYPLKTGNECTVRETTTFFMPGSGKQTSDSETRMYITETDTFQYKVDSIENVTVPAGTFECFKVDMYDDEGTILRTSWKSHQIKHLEVKSLNHQSNETTELISFTLSE